MSWWPNGEINELDELKIDTDELKIDADELKIDPNKLKIIYDVNDNDLDIPCAVDTFSTL
jgi:hypothetical protein